MLDDDVVYSRIKPRDVVVGGLFSLLIASLPFLEGGPGYIFVSIIAWFLYVSAAIILTIALSMKPRKYIIVRNKLLSWFSTFLTLSCCCWLIYCGYVALPLLILYTVVTTRVLARKWEKASFN